VLMTQIVIFSVVFYSIMDLIEDPCS
jgi:hypothetical protein